MSKKRLGLLAAVFVILAIVPAYAHHGAAGYEMSKTVTVTGTVTQYDYVNPHVRISLDVKNDSGNIEKWEGEMTSPNHLSRVGWNKNTIKVGDKITLTGAAAKSGSFTMVIRKVLKDGEEIQTTE
jgi:hypothetical protein